MIFVPKKEDCTSWNECDNGVYISYHYEKKFPIIFLWGKTPKVNDNGDIIYTVDYDPFYLSIKECMNNEVLNCSSKACSAKPQLRYNKIIDKWFCNCPSSALCTKNNDQDEIDSGLIDINHINIENGYCDNPIEAILMWNKLFAQSYIDIANGNIKIFNEMEN